MGSVALPLIAGPPGIKFPGSLIPGYHASERIRPAGGVIRLS